MGIRNSVIRVSSKNIIVTRNGQGVLENKSWWKRVGNKLGCKVFYLLSYVTTKIQP